MSIWDEPIKDNGQENEYPVLPAGTYSFEVRDASGEEYTPTATSKIKTRCAQINIKLRCEGEQDVTVFDRLYSAENTAWKITQFAKCIGIYHEGMTPKEVIDKSIGEIGKCKLEVHEYNGKKSNRVKEYIVPETKKDDLPF